MKSFANNDCEGSTEYDSIATVAVQMATVSSRVVDIEDEDIVGANPSQVVHYESNPFLFHHRADCNPSFSIESSNCRRSFTGGYFTSIRKPRSLDIVLAQHVSLSSNNSSDSRSNQVNHVRV
uniref:Uncharacterized protein n=1 Tax=Photinus pyralis TaxID=7054 RepID=A0A1Y1MXL8_PHOPY